VAQGNFSRHFENRRSLRLAMLDERWEWQMWSTPIGEFIWCLARGPASTKRELDEMVDLSLVDL
jgi:hypothetical protein